MERMISGPANSPATAAAAPRTPQKPWPTMMAVFIALGPGSTWPRPSRSANSRSVSQPRFSTSMRRAQALAPPKLEIPTWK